MFDNLLSDARHLERYKSGPFAEERERFLIHLNEVGYSRSRLLDVNSFLLAVARHVCLDGDTSYSPEELATVARKCIQEKPRKASKKSLHAMELDFRCAAIGWMRFLGLLIVPESPQPYALELESFLTFLRDERGLADATIGNRRRSLNKFLSWIESKEVSLADVNVNAVTEYHNLNGRRGWKRSTISQNVQSLRAFFRFAGQKGWCRDISHMIEAPRLYSNEGIPEGPSWEDVKKLLDNERGDSPVRIRNRAMFLLFALYGFRLSEVRLLELDDLDWESERILLRRSKLRKTQEYPLHREVGDVILRYLQEVRPRSIHRHVFLSLRQPYRPLSVGAVGTQVQKRMRNISDKFVSFGPHALRHACATHLLSEGFTLKQIGDHLGHVSVAATRMYAKVDLPGLREVANMNMSELVAYAEHAEQNQTPVIPYGELAGLRVVADLPLGALL